MSDEENEYEGGKIVSWDLVGSVVDAEGLVRSSTVGIIEPGPYCIPTTHREQVTVLSGVLIAGEDVGERKEYRPFETADIGAGVILNLEVRDQSVLYICRYLQG